MLVGQKSNLHQIMFLLTVFKGLESNSHIDCQARPCLFGLSDMIFGVIFVHLIIKCLHDCFIIGLSLRQITN